MSNGKHEQNSDSRHSAAAALGTVIVLIVAVGLFLYRDKLPGYSSSVFKSNSENQIISSTSEPFTYENGSNQIFTHLNGKLAISSSTGLQVLDDEGLTICREVFSMNNPAVCTGKTDIIFYDVGSTSLRAVRGHTVTNLNTEENIISVSSNSENYIAVSHMQSGYKGAVTVLNSDYEPIFEWFSGKGYLIDAVISPDNKTLAVLCLESEGCTIHIMEIGKNDKIVKTPISEQIFFDICFNSDNTICALSESSITFYSTDGSQTQYYEFGDGFLAEYSLSEDLIAIVLSNYTSGNNVSILSFLPSGKVYGEATLTEEPLAVSSCDNRLLVLGSDLITVFSDDMSIKNQNHVVPGYRDAILLPSNEVLLLSSHYGEKYSLS